MPDSSRSLFYGLQLRSVGAPDTEGLRSYVQRLSAEHSIVPRVLIAMVGARQGSGGFRTEMSAVWKTFAVCGTSDRASILASMISEATGVDLTTSTLGRFAGVISARRLCHATSPFYCPECVRLRIDDAHVHGQLLWELRMVTACPVHGSRLRPAAACGAPPTERLPINRRVSLPGVCSTCGSIGYRCTHSSELATAREIWVAQQAGRLLALTAEESAALTREALTAGLRDLVAVRFDGKPVRAAVQAKLARATALHWLESDEPVELPALFELAYLADADVRELFRGRYVELAKGDEFPRDGTLSRILQHRYERHDWGPVHAALLQAANDDTAPSLRSVLRRFGVDASQARRTYPTECRAVASRHEVARRRRWQDSYTTAFAAYSAAAEELHRRGIELTRIRIQEAAGLYCVAGSRTSHRARALEDVLMGSGSRALREAAGG